MILIQGEIMKKARSIKAFCYEHDMSKTTYYKLKKLGLAPATMIVGRRRMISDEAAHDWRIKMAQQGGE